MILNLLTVLVLVWTAVGAQIESGKGASATLNDIEPIYEDLKVKEKVILAGNPWGKVQLTSIPVPGATDRSVSKIKVLLKITCKNREPKRILILEKSFCSYQNAEFDKEANKENALINSWIYKPELNITQNGKEIVILTKSDGVGTSCGANETVRLPIMCD